ncbi:MAG: serine/threonine protein kinase [Planctomycetes bacterium]|nr:serine/threonine protein kinase [Planctomycetota bacterium]
MAAIEKGVRLGEYVLVERIGEGGFGEVWRAENPDLPGSVVAVKIARGPHAVELLQRGGALQYQMRHPAIVPTISLNMVHEPPYLVMEFVGGETIRCVLDRCAKIPWPDAVRMAQWMLHGLAYAHSFGILHGDLSPENLLLDVDGRVRITDFGIARLAASPAAGVQHSGEAARAEIDRVQGTIRYMAPERRSGARPDIKSDICSAGLVLHEMLTGDSTYLRFPVLDTPEWLSNVVEKATWPEPSARYPGAAVMLEAINRGLRESPLAPTRSSRLWYAPPAVPPAPTWSGLDPIRPLSISTGSVHQAGRSSGTPGNVRHAERIAQNPGIAKQAREGPIAPVAQGQHLRRDLGAVARDATARQDYTGRAFLTAVLYLFCFLPGLLLNIAFLMSAQAEQTRTGNPPPGKGCLAVMLGVALAVLVLAALAQMGALR